MKIRTFLRTLLFPPRCIVCGERQNPVREGEVPAFCAACRSQFEKETRRQCADCFREAYRCRCVPPAMKRAGYAELIKSAFYGNGEDTRAARGLVLRLKDRNVPAAFRAAAADLAPEVRATLQAGQYDPAHTVLTWLPRTHRAKRRTGHDQAECLAAALARELGIPAAPLFCRVRDGKAQKGLSVAARRRNLAGAFSLTGDVRGLTVLVTDDVVTTGAGMAEAAGLLKKAGAAAWIGVAVAFTPRKKEISK